MPLWSPPRPLSVGPPCLLCCEPEPAQPQNPSAGFYSHRVTQADRLPGPSSMASGMARKRPGTTVRLRKGERELGQDALVGYGWGRGSSGAARGHPATEPTAEFWLCSLYKQPSFTEDGRRVGGGDVETGEGTATRASRRPR